MEFQDGAVHLVCFLEQDDSCLARDGDLFKDTKLGSSEPLDVEL